MEVPSDQLKPVKDQDVPRRKGGLKTMPFVISNEALEKVASIGLQVNMIFYLTEVYHLSNATSLILLFAYNAISHFLPVFGAFLSDSCLGRFRVIGLGTIVTTLGILVLWFTALFKHARPPQCDLDVPDSCVKPKAGQLAILLLSFILMAIGAGGIRPCSLAFGADQFDNPDNPNNGKVLQTFFNWYYASVGISVLLAFTVIVYIQTRAGWVVGFAVPFVLMLISCVMFFLGSGLYVKIKAKKSLLTEFAQVISAARKNKHLEYPPADADGVYHHRKGSRLVVPTERLRFLNKACIIRNPATELKVDGTAADPWRLCTVHQVETLKALIKVLPIWSTGIMIAVTISQHAFPVLQANSMHRRLSEHFEIPAGSFGVFGVVALTIWLAIYDRLAVPLLAKYTKHPRGITLRQRMGAGLALSCMALAVAAIVERTRRARAIHEGLADKPQAVVNMSAMWLVPQHCLTGIAEAFNAIGQIQFYYSQFPRSMGSIGVALFSMGMGIGNLVGSLIVTILSKATKGDGKGSWVSNNINHGHYDYYYWILFGLCVVNFFYFVYCSWAYGSEEQNVWDDVESSSEEDLA
ncbi:hypothetical protein NMG60_11013430 [Bertholletia excelsa]